MNNIMTHVVTEGTGRAAQIPGLAISGKTGTTNNSTNAWFNAFTGNLVGSVWFGNDDNTPMENMTGGILPAHDLAGDHGLRPPGTRGEAAVRRRLRPRPRRAQPAAGASAKAAQSAEASPPPIGLSPRATKAILDIGDLAPRGVESGQTSAAPQADPGATDRRRRDARERRLRLEARTHA